MITNQKAFTLIELLATLTIMAVIAAILFPFVTNYTKKANHDTALRSLRILQDAMDRYRSAAVNFNGWPLGDSGITGTSPYDVYRVLTEDQVNQILGDMLAQGSNQTLKIPIDQLTPTNIVVVSTGMNQLASGWEVLWFRRNINAMGVDRKGNDIANTNAEKWLPTSEEIDAAFQ